MTMTGSTRYLQWRARTDRRFDPACVAVDDQLFAGPGGGGAGYGTKREGGVCGAGSPDVLEDEIYHRTWSRTQTDHHGGDVMRLSLVATGAGPVLDI